MLNKTKYCAAILVLLFHFPIAAASAGVVITIENAQFNPGNGGLVNVLIRSDGIDELSDFGFEFLIERVGPTATQLQFTAPQSDLQLADADYVFANGSLKRDGDLAFNIAPDFVGAVNTSLFQNDTFIGSDSSAPFGGSVDLDSTNKLLVRLQLSPGSGLLAPVVGDQFRISLVDAGFTSFLDPNANPIVFTSSSGIVSVTAVPEPSSGLLLGLLSIVAVMQNRRRVSRPNKFCILDSKLGEQNVNNS